MIPLRRHHHIGGAYTVQTLCSFEQLAEDKAKAPCMDSSFSCIITVSE